MLNLKNIILNIEEEDFLKVSESFKLSKADKYFSLLNYYRENSLDDDQILERLNINNNSFYVLKSRLFDKIQNYLLEHLSGPKAEVLKKVVNIPYLVFDTQRDIAIAILKKLEKDLIDYDMPNELTVVYDALKKLHINTDKYFEYSKLYNKHVAYTLAYNKAEDLVTDFTIKVGAYLTSRSVDQLEILPLIKKEVAHLSNLYDSHHLRVFKNIVDASVAIFLPLEEAIVNDAPIEDILGENDEIIQNYSKDIHYQFLNKVNDFLYFEYYNKLGLNKKKAQYFDQVNEGMPNFLYYNHCCVCSKFLISKIEHYIYLGREEELYGENQAVFSRYSAEKDDTPNYIYYNLYLSSSAYYAKKYQESIKILVGLLNDISFKNYPHAEIEVKLFLALVYSFANKYDLAWNILRSSSRKIRELNKDMSYENAAIFTKILKAQIGSQKKGIEIKIRNLKTNFELLNQGPKRMLEFVKMDDRFVAKLSQAIK